MHAKSWFWTEAGRPRRGVVVGLLLAALALPLAFVARSGGPAFRPAQPGTTVVPDRFLRGFDPLTFFFERDLGPVNGGPEDRPERFVSLQPAQPGAFTWLDARTLEFRPADPWPPLARFRVQADGKRFELATLLAPPVETTPADGSEGLERLSAVQLYFAQPVDPQALAKVVRLELRPLPGLAGDAARFLDADDFRVKTLERRDPSASAGYELALVRPVPPGTRVIVRFQLSLDTDAPKALSTVSFSTVQPFRPVAFGCPSTVVPVSPEGAELPAAQALRCEGGSAGVVVDFTTAPQEVSEVDARNLVRIAPPVTGLQSQLYGTRLWLTGNFARDTRYQVDLAPAALRDRQGRGLELSGTNRVYVYFPASETFLRFAEPAGVAERFGPQQVPLVGRGQDRVDVRIQKVDPLDRGLWPFPQYGALQVDESERPPGPGEEPEPFVDPEERVDGEGLARRVLALGSPAVSRLVPLPLARTGGAASFGLDLAGLLREGLGADKPGTYLVGLRSLDGSPTRSWMRLNVTDLALTTVEEPRRVVFVVTSLASGKPVAGARVRLEGSLRTAGVATAGWRTLFEGATDAEGRLAWAPPGPEKGRSATVRRIVVEKAGDVVVLDPTRAPDYFSDGAWLTSRNVWLQWSQEELDARGPQARRVAHLFSERPVYRPEEAVHLKGFVRRQTNRDLTPVTGTAALVIEGPGERTFRYPVTLSAQGSVYHRFAEEKLPTGTYTAWLELANPNERVGQVSFRMEAYRLPQFEVALDAPDRVPLDRPFDVKLNATYYAGGRVADRPVGWRVTQFPYVWKPAARPGFLFSSDGRFSSAGRFESTPTLSRTGATDAEGAAVIELDPTVEPTAQARTYVVEATVTGADDQTVTATRRVTALPAFLVGLKVPRFLEPAAAREVRPEIVVLGPDEKPIAGQALTVRLIHRQWHSHLRASDFTDGVARYTTEVVDEKLSEKKVTSSAEPLTVALPLPEAGVYLVEVEGQDRLGRAQVVSVDLFASGAEAVAWAKPGGGIFKVVADKESYKPGETANLVLQSPFQSARALAIIEAPAGVEHRWLEVEGGKATLALPIQGKFAPRLPVHFLLMRGRLAGTQPAAAGPTDLGKPATVGATAWLNVEPVDNRLDVKLDHPARSLPGKTIEVEVSLADPQGRPLAGEVTLWLVDQAVLALGQEQRLDPLPDFLPRVRAWVVARDTRNAVFGVLPLAPVPGGDEGLEAKSLFDRQTVRRNFQPVPFYEPTLVVGPSGKLRVPVQLPDNLTNFKLRAKAISGAERFGWAVGHLEVRLPVIVQPALPRFVRPGDRFSASAIGRIVEGEGGAGRVEARFEGVTLTGPSARSFTWNAAAPERFDFEVSVPTPSGTEPSPLATFRVGVERASDGAGDAFEVSLPIVDDREPVRVRALVDLEPGKPIALPEPREAVRPGTLERSVLVSNQPALVRMAAGLDFLLAYPYACTEQRLSLARGQLALGKLRALLHQGDGKAELDRAVRDTLEWLPQVLTPRGLLAYWPGADGYVSLTAWGVEFLVEAKQAGYGIDEKLLGTLTRALEQALRSDYGGFVRGEEWGERTWALRALAATGKLEAGYADELARQSQFLALEDVAGVLLALERGRRADSPAVARLKADVWNGIGTQLFQGREIFAGLKDQQRERNRLILPSESRTLAEMLRALARVDAKNPKLPLLVDGLARLGRDDGWGDTNANSAALLALAEVVQPPFAGGARGSAEVVVGGERKRLEVAPGQPTAFWTSGAAGAASLSSPAAGLVARTELRYVPAADGSQAAPRRDGFVVRREAQVWKTEPPVRLPLTEAGMTVKLEVGTVVEEHVEVVNPADRNFVAIVVPLAAGLEPLNPALATAPPEARPSGSLTLEPTYVAFLDDHVAFYYDTLPKGTYDFYFRTRATTPGRFLQPPAKAEMMYDGAVVGTSAGARVEVVKAAGEAP